MKLKDFITETLKEIIDGVKGAQQYAAEAGGAINPKGLMYLEGSSGTVQHQETSRIGQELEFDIEITASEEEKTKGGAGIFISAICLSDRTYDHGVFAWHRFQSDFYLICIYGSINRRDFQKYRYFCHNAKKDLSVAKNSNVNEVIFTFAYQAFLKFGISAIAQEGYKVKSRMGHHIQIIHKLSEILNDEQVGFYGEAMRRKRNIDLYAGGTIVTKKEALEYLKFIEEISKNI